MTRQPIQAQAHHADPTVPRPVLAMAGALILATLALTAMVRVGWLDRQAVPSVERTKAAVTPVEVRHLSFTDRADGAVLVHDRDSGVLLATLLGENDGGGFVRGVMRGMARERRQRGIGATQPFELTLWRNGSLSLVDPTTGRSIELGSFGPSNRAAFARFLRGSRA